MADWQSTRDIILISVAALILLTFAVTTITLLWSRKRPTATSDRTAAPLPLPNQIEEQQPIAAAITITLDNPAVSKSEAKRESEQPLTAEIAPAESSAAGDRGEAHRIEDDIAELVHATFANLETKDATKSKASDPAISPAPLSKLPANDKPSHATTEPEIIDEPGTLITSPKSQN